MAQSEVEGFEIAFHSSLSEPVTIAGVPRMIAVLNGTLTAVLALGLQVPLIGIPIGLAIHGACYWLNKRDPYFFDALGRQVRSLLDEHLEAGDQHVIVDAGDLSSGSYIYRLDIDGEMQGAGRMVLVR